MPQIASETHVQAGAVHSKGCSRAGLLMTCSLQPWRSGAVARVPAVKQVWLIPISPCLEGVFEGCWWHGPPWASKAAGATQPPGGYRW